MRRCTPVLLCRPSSWPDSMVKVVGSGIAPAFVA